ncbi:DUF1460 domain-containing protein [bacterium]|nr:DUF1460 domain-containing protein [bacterium]
MIDFPKKLIALFISLSEKPLSKRIEEFSNFFLDYPYRLSPLGEGSELPRYSFDYFDCMTFVETVLALALAPSPKEFLCLLDKLRYKNAEVGFFSRNHFVTADWLVNNRWCLENKTIELYPEAPVCSRTIDKARFFSEKERAFEGLDLKPLKVDLPYIPVQLGPAPIPAAKLPLIALFVGKKPGLVVTHMGFLLAANSSVILRHASSRTGKIVDQKFEEYMISRNDRIIGYSVIQVKTGST